MKRLRIAQLVPPWITTPPKGYGGVELVVSLLTEELVRRGHVVELIASGDSHTHGRLHSAWPKAVYQLPEFESAIQNPSMAKYWLPSLFALSHVTETMRKLNVDIIHNNFHWFGLLLAPYLPAPMVTTWHGSFEGLEPVELELFRRHKKHPVVAISQRQKAGDQVGLNFVGVVPHGIRLDEYKFSNKPGTYVAWLGRITAKKGVEEAIRIARRVKKPIRIAGVVNPVDQAYFTKRIKPLLDGKNATYIGPVNQKQKIKFLGGAESLLYPLKWEEPFGLVLLESLACGTPVVALDRGAAGEIVQTGLSGFIAHTNQELELFLHKSNQLSRLAARKRAEHFSVERMAEQYEKIYNRFARKP
ncbi:MAG: glycosyltransferase family 4 protein [Patescibacteria group bacterium]